MGQIKQNLVKIIFMTMCILISECSSSAYLEKVFNIAKNEQFISDNVIPEVGHLKNISTASPMDCNMECVKDSKCTQTNVEQLTETTWSCDLFGSGRGTKTSSPDHVHYFMTPIECDGSFLTTIHSGSAYRVNHEALSWTDAQIRCREYGATLATIEDASEHADLQAYLQNNAQASVSYSIGLNKRADSQTWVWSATGATPTFLTWATDEPYTGDGQECVMMCYHQNFDWCDTSCSSLKGFICEC